MQLKLEHTGRCILIILMILISKNNLLRLRRYIYSIDFCFVHGSFGLTLGGNYVAHSNQERIQKSNCWGSSGVYHWKKFLKMQHNGDLWSIFGLCFKQRGIQTHDVITTAPRWDCMHNFILQMQSIRQSYYTSTLIPRGKIKVINS
jgi:hypothetical protein